MQQQRAQLPCCAPSPSGQLLNVRPDVYLVQHSGPNQIQSEAIIALVSIGLSGSAFGPSIQRVRSVGTVRVENDRGPHVVTVEVLVLERRPGLMLTKAIPFQVQ